MSIFSKIFKGVKKIFKGVKKIVKKTFKRVAKVFKAVVKYGKKFLKSKLGKALMIGVAIYFGGAALGAWGSTGSAGALAGSTAGTTLGAPAVVTSAVPALVPEIATTALGAATTAAPVVELAAASALPGSIATGAAAAPGLVESAVSLGKAAGGWMTANPALTVAGAQGVQAALAPDPYEEALKAEEERRRRSNIAGIYGSGEGEAIGLGLLDRAQTADLYTPTYQRSVGG